MKKGIHPEYHEIKVVMTDGTEYLTRSTYGEPGAVLHLDINSRPIRRGPAAASTSSIAAAACRASSPATRASSAPRRFPPTADMKRPASRGPFSFRMRLFPGSAGPYREEPRRSGQAVPGRDCRSAAARRRRRSRRAAGRAPEGGESRVMSTRSRSGRPSQPAPWVAVDRARSLTLSFSPGPARRKSRRC